MALQASGNSISFSQIETEFGQNTGRTLGNYRMNDLNIGSLTEVSLSRDGCGINANSNIPVDDNEIKFSDFYNAKQNIIIDCFSSNQNRINAKNDKYNAASSSGNYVVVGPGSKPSNTNGKKVIIHVTKLIGSATGNATNVALRTGSFDTGTDLLIEVATGGVIAGAGGNGGNGRESASGLPGSDGTSGLGIDYNGTKIQTTGTGTIIAGFGGGGAGGGGETKKEGGTWGGGRGPEVKAGGGGGGGGQGIPGGSGGTSPEGNAHAGAAGDHEEAGNGGEGAEVASRGDATINGGQGGQGGWIGDFTADTGANAFLSGNRHENPSTTAGGIGGSNGAAIRTGSGINFTLIGTPTINGDTNATGVT
tara:strand:+ start:47 stop:1138 length:1092 start_codon:yes stop_codon:yes gene_type:complete